MGNPNPVGSSTGKTYRNPIESHGISRRREPPMRCSMRPREIPWDSMGHPTGFYGEVQKASKPFSRLSAVECICVRWQTPVQMQSELSFALDRTAFPSILLPLLGDYSRHPLTILCTPTFLISPLCHSLPAPEKIDLMVLYSANARAALGAGAG